MELERKSRFEIEEELSEAEEEEELEIPETTDPDEDEDGDGDCSSNLDQTGFLLARLQELKQWQKEQERKLLQDQREEMYKIQGQGPQPQEPVAHGFGTEGKSNINAKNAHPSLYFERIKMILYLNAGFSFLLFDRTFRR